MDDQERVTRAVAELAQVFTEQAKYSMLVGIVLTELLARMEQTDLRNRLEQATEELSQEVQASRDRMKNHGQ